MESRWMLVGAAVFAALSGLWVHHALRSREERILEGWAPVGVLVAAADLDEGAVVESGHLVAAEMPERFVSPSMVRPGLAETLVGQTLLVPLRKGDPVLWSHFRAAEEGGRLSEKILQRTRAVTVSVTEKSSVGGWIQPNDHVDVLATFRDPASQEMITVTLLHNVIVLATGRSAGREFSASFAHGYTDVSLLVLPEEAELLVLAQELGTITLVLRHPDEAEVERERGRATVETLLTGERSRALEQIRRERVQVIRGRVAGLSE